MQYRTSFFILIFFVLTGCQAHRLNVQTQYISREDIASFYVGTPDAEKDCPTIGQRLLIEWMIPKEYLCYPDLKLILKVRFKNRKEEESSMSIKDKKGTYLFYVVNDKFCETGGISTYKVEIRAGQCILDSWLHPLWMDLITFPVIDNCNVPEKAD